MTGYIAMSRAWQDHEVFEGDEFSRRDAWAWLIAQAAWKPSHARIKGSRVDLQRGELTFSVRFLADKWGWSKSRVDRFIATLREEGMIETRSKIGTTAGRAAGQGQSIITICNYDKYQRPLKSERDNDSQEIGTTAGQQRDKEEEGKEGKKAIIAGKPARPKVFPENWSPDPFGQDTEAGKIVASWPPGEFDRQFERFSDHHRAKGSRFSDWQAAWGTWARNSVAFGRADRGFSPRPTGEPIPLYKHLAAAGGQA